MSRAGDWPATKRTSFSLNDRRFTTVFIVELRVVARVDRPLAFIVKVTAVDIVASDRRSHSRLGHAAPSLTYRLMESIFAIGLGLALRILVDGVSHHNSRVGGSLVGLWEGVVLNHFLDKMPMSFDPYVAYGFRLFVDFLFTESLSRLVIVILWTGLGVLLSDIGPVLWYSTGLKYIYRRLRRDLKHFRLPSLSFFSKRSPRVRYHLPSPSQSASSATTSRSITARQTLIRLQPSLRRPPGAFPGDWSESDDATTVLPVPPPSNRPSPLRRAEPIVDVPVRASEPIDPSMENPLLIPDNIDEPPPPDSTHSDDDHHESPLQPPPESADVHEIPPALNDMPEISPPDLPEASKSGPLPPQSSELGPPPPPFEEVEGDLANRGIGRESLPPPFPDDAFGLPVPRTDQSIQARPESAFSDDSTTHILTRAQLCREEARRAEKERDEYRSARTVALEKSQIEDAFRFLQKAEEADERAQLWHEKAERRYFHGRNPPATTPLQEIDVRGLTVSEALKRVQKRVGALLDEDGDKLRVTVGGDGESIQHAYPLKASILNSMRDHGIAAMDDPLNSKVVIIKLPS